MLPRPVLEDGPDGLAGNAEPLGEAVLAVSEFHMKPLDFGHGLLVELSVPVFTALGGLIYGGWSPTPLGGHVGSVVRPGTDEQVIRSDAVADIALVQDTETLGNGTVVKFPGYPVGSVGVGVHGDNPVPVWLSGPSPEPASIRLLNPSPEPLEPLLSGERHGIAATITFGCMEHTRMVSGWVSQVKG